RRRQAARLRAGQPAAVLHQEVRAFPHPLPSPSPRGHDKDTLRTAMERAGEGNWDKYVSFSPLLCLSAKERGPGGEVPMLQYVARRLLFMIPTLIVISIVSFILIQLPPGDFLASYASTLAQRGE